MEVRIGLAALAAALCAWVPARLSAQTFLDRGSFVMVRDGIETAREEFAVRATTGRGRGMLVVSTTRSTGREIRHALEVGPDFAPVSFEQTESADGQVVRRVSAQILGNRFTARLASPEGETAREFPVRPPVVILGDDQASAFYFVRRAADVDRRTVSLIRPSSLRPIAATVEALGNDTVTVAGRSLTALRFVMRASDGDERFFWFSPEGDLLRVARPADGTVTTRGELPSH